jgi:hypothetical protein
LGPLQDVAAPSARFFFFFCFFALCLAEVPPERANLVAA